MVVAENSILLALPVLASFNVSTLLELHGRSLCGIWLFWNIKVLRLNRLRCCLPLACSRRFSDFRWLANFGGLRCCLPLACSRRFSDFRWLANFGGLRRCLPLACSRRFSDLRWLANFGGLRRCLPLACSRWFTNLRGLTRSRWFPCGRRLACPFGLADFCRLTNTRRLACSCGFARSRRFSTRLRRNLSSLRTLFLGLSLLFWRSLRGCDTRKC